MPAIHEPSLAGSLAQVEVEAPSFFRVAVDLKNPALNVAAPLRAA
jgi:hypothetical protein